MKQILLLTSLLLIAVNCHANDLPAPLNESQIKHIAIYCKFWGFLKYYHPAVADGNLDWDYIFVDIYPKIKGAKSEADFNDALLELYQKAEYARKDSQHATINSNFNGEEIQIADFEWLKSHDLFGDKVLEMLNKIKREYRPQNNHYISGGDVGNPNLDHDNEFELVVDPSEPFRLLALARYWNIINYFYVYKDVIGSPWDSILFAFVPRLAQSGEAKEYHHLIKELCNSINDSHSVTTSPLEKTKYYYVPFMLSYVERKVVISDTSSIISNTDSIFTALGLHKGDFITKINGKEVETLLNDLLMYEPHSNLSSGLRNVCYRLLSWNEGDTLIFTVNNGRSLHDVIIPLTKLDYGFGKKVQHPIAWKILDSNIGFVDMGKLDPKSVKQMLVELQYTKAVIFDVRNYPHGAFMNILNSLTTSHDFFYATRPDFSHPGYILKDTSESKIGMPDSTDIQSNIRVRRLPHYKMTPIILVNEMTQSHAEFTVMALQTIPNAKTFGSQTAGADGDVSTMQLPGGIKTTFSGIGIFYPDGTPTQRVGIKIDYEVKPTIKGIREGRDEVLERAIKYINTGS